VPFHIHVNVNHGVCVFVLLVVNTAKNHSLQDDDLVICRLFLLIQHGRAKQLVPAVVTRARGDIVGFKNFALLLSN
jgi:hypothetical protein